MAAPACSEERFIALWREYASPVEVAKALDVSLRRVMHRRRTIEKRLGIQLPTISEGRPIGPSAGAVAKLEVSDGVVLIGSDAHIWPGPLTTMQRAFLQFVKKIKPVAVIANGDFFDGAKVSRWPSIGWEQKPSVRQELEAVQDYMDQVFRASKNSKRFWPLGNHDARFEHRIANLIPEYEGIKGVHLKDHMPGWQPCWRVDINDDVVVRHREFGGEHADWNNVVKSGKTIVTGHDHRTGVTPFRNYRGLQWGVRCGYMCDSPLDPQFVNYMEAREPNWVPAFVVLTFRGGRLLWPELVTRHEDGKVEYRGEVIDV